MNCIKRDFVVELCDEAFRNFFEAFNEMQDSLSVPIRLYQLGTVRMAYGQILGIVRCAWANYDGAMMFARELTTIEAMADQLMGGALDIYMGKNPGGE